MGIISLTILSITIALLVYFLREEKVKKEVFINKEYLGIQKYGIIKISKGMWSEEEALFPSNSHYKGEVNSMGEFIVAAYDFAQVGYLYNLRNLSAPEINLQALTPGDYYYQCFFQRDSVSVALCCGNKGVIVKYNIGGSSLAPQMFSRLPTLNSITSCAGGLSGGYLVAATYYGEIYILNNTGSVISSNTTESGSVIYDIAVIDTQTLISVSTSGYTLLDLLNIPHIPIYPYYTQEKHYYTVLALKNTYFGIGGYSGDLEYYGIITINELKKELRVAKYKEYVTTTKYCAFRSIAEYISGAIIATGDEECGLCTWNYIDDAKPFCYLNQLRGHNDTIFDIIVHF